MSDQERLPPQEQAGSEGKPRLSWSTKHGTTRADSNVGGYWITWTTYSWCRWFNCFVRLDNKTRCVGAGNCEQAKAAAEAHYAKLLSSNNDSQPQGALAL